MNCPCASVISLSTALSRSSNSPRNFAPAISAPRSSETSRLFLSPSGHVAVRDPLRQPLGDRRLADARLADQHRIVLRAAREHLDHPADLLVPPDHRVELALARRVREVARVPLQRLVLVLRRLVGHPVRPAHRLRAPSSRAVLVAPDAVEQRLRSPCPCVATAPAAGARSRCTRRRAPRLTLGPVQHTVQLAGQRRLGVALLGEALDLRSSCSRSAATLTPSFCRIGHDDPFVLPEQRQQKVRVVHQRVAVLARQRDCAFSASPDFTVSRSGLTTCLSHPW